MNFKGKACRAGKDYFFMDIKGEMFKCGTTLEPLGNLFTGTFKPNKQALPCPVSHCNDSCQGFTSLVEEPKTPTLDSDLKYAVLKNYHKVKELLTP